MEGWPRMIEPLAAATVMVARDTGANIEIFLLRRSSSSAFMPDIFVFPGGRVDVEDRAPGVVAPMSGSNAQLESAVVCAAARETFEEAGLLFATRAFDGATLTAARERVRRGTHSFARMLTALGTAVDPAALHYFSRWITPPGEVRRFDTHFFAARLPAGQTAQADAYETYDGVWIAPREALARHAAGNFALILPTLKHLERLCPFASVDALLEFAERKAILPVVPEACADRQYGVPPALEGEW